MEANEKKLGGINRTDVVVAFLIVAIIGLIIVPLPPMILDLLIVVNLTIAINILLITLFTKNVLEFSTFPTVLLITTIFRLSLNLSSTRLILSQGNGGHVIDAFANVVTGSNYIVGIILFIIIMIVQLAVVTKGAGRVSEVSARFTLDAMPGKQMSIDADLNNGLITEEQARIRRKDLQREADFYGSMDGASKFVKGDAIAGVLITLINLIGGAIIFSVNGSLSITEALSQFGKLSIGDGLVSAIPSLLISIASGVIVTRSDNDSTFGLDILQDATRNPNLFRIVSVILFILALVPGFPFIPFVLIGLGLIGASFMIKQQAEKEIQREKEMQRKLALQRKKEAQEEDDSVASFQVEPIAIEIGYGLIPLVDSSIDNSLMSRIVAIRKQSAHELGILVSPVRIRDNLYLEANTYSIKIRGNEVGKGEVYPNQVMVIAQNDEPIPFRGIATKEPAFHLDAMWINEAEKENAELQGFTVIEPLTVIATHLKEVIYAHASELLGRQEVKKLLEGIKDQNNVVIDELIPDIMRLGEVQKVLQNLLDEKIPINDLATILETLADYGLVTKDTEMLTEYVRQSLKRTIANKYADEEHRLNVIVIHPKIEDMIAQSIQKTATGSFPVLKPDMVNQLLETIGTQHHQLLANQVPHVILASPKIRLAFRKIISFNFPDIAVLSLNEVPNEIMIETVGNIEF
ncbi:flagellar biosynthesis protein FlhA [Enterococcus columbae]|uniref:Flagellar biosynthesis protein FlhA n=1 Tax=Enterococcus columbae DSM 7374 = ATCC 51263 TaxID=1121865 RepID=S1NSX4_9ENTE|nr:flagellar biosynthesis protein FlhA [Enterococcus columbae]EOT39994.1 flagellar biosynthesis protein FlhA [Enterococcus columbae DSM 7374 = ATCC 51263]EOW83979.1 flagellar biosynthesis protein FlhA [Enterococcus columbae DSM 7374 = ATCC 51263]OJG25802.1 flagellar biosynthesis protein FlhA [Enterococcus columbae DSM 7374 = ATCC 51263]